jgi:cytochrome c-type biogenesis protein CcmH
MVEARVHRAAVALVLMLAFALPAVAKEASPLASNPEIEARVMAIALELRCLVCQNQTLADSHADLAVDLRRQIREMLERGQSDDQVRAYMTERYGDFVLYKPPFKPTTALLWAGPGVLLVAALGTLFLILRRRQRLGADAFEPDTDDVTPDDADPSAANR